MKTIRILFGTDGIRGNAGEYPFDDVTLAKIGFAIANLSTNDSTVLIGRDTRESGERISKSIAAGLLMGGKNVHDAGILSTPALSYFLNRSGYQYSYGIMVSASHNAYYDNGIKVLNGSGQKITDDEETKIEQEIETIEEPIILQYDAIENVSDQTVQRYIEPVSECFQKLIEMNSLRIVVDTANGATVEIAPAILKSFVRELFVINNKPNGRNINYECGSTNLDSLIKAVLANKADLGLAFDGDGDRVLFVDHEGNIVDGDHILAFSAKHMISTGELKGNTVVSTIMANYGLEEVLGKLNIKLERTAVGDRYVWKRMNEIDSYLGGEQSGHIIYRHHSMTGDGIITALKVLETISATGKTLKELAHILTKYPQILLNVKVEKKLPLEQLPNLQNEKKRIEKEMGEGGRILLRYSGTENILRIMIEGKNKIKIAEYADRLATAAKNDLSKE